MKLKHSLLIVDDSKIMRLAISQYLADFDIHIAGQAADGNEALWLFKQLQPDFVTLDLTMPEPDGITVLREMVKINPAVRILIITALTDKATEFKVIKMGARAILHKPFTADKLQKVFKRLVAEIKEAESSK